MFQENFLKDEKWLNVQRQVQDGLPSLDGQHIVIIGDVGLDEYVLGDVTRISPEAPVPVVDVKSREVRVGLAANVAQNIASLGGKASLVGVIGHDSSGEELLKILQEGNVDTKGLVEDLGRPTTKKTRVMAGHHHIVRVDNETRQFLSAETEANLLKKVEELVPQCDGVVLEDYGKGVFSKEATQKIIALSHQHKKKVIVDPHRTTPVNYYESADVLKPNRDEAYILSGLNIDDLRQDEASFHQVAKALMEKVKVSHLVVTQGKEGMSVFSEKEVAKLPTFARQVFDVTGAGDTVLAAISLGWFSGMGLEEACILANFAAGVVVGKIGSVPCSKEDLKLYLQKHFELLKETK